MTSKRNDTAVSFQTLLFSLLVHRKMRASEHPLPPIFTTALKALAMTCFSFMGYTVVSLAFAFAAGVGIAEGSGNSRVLGQFIGPLVVTFVIIMAGRDRWWLPEHGAMYLLSAASLFLYQKFVLGSAGASYVLLAPILPVVISLLLTKPKKNPGNRSGAGDSPAE